jgi:molecular chaperone GrpE
MEDRDTKGQDLDLEHELPQGDGVDVVEPQPGAPENQPRTGVGTAGELDKLRGERDLLLDRLARLQAEFDNYRKRASREQSDYREYALADAVRSLLPILDSFERALKTGQNQTGDFRTGVELIYKQFSDALGKLGATQVAAEGQPFDPRYHEAIEMVETSDAKDNHVIEVLQRGYRMKDRLLRPAMVRVARNPKH